MSKNGKPCRARHQDYVKGCPSCERAKHDVRFQKAWGLPVTGTIPESSPAAAVPALSCRYLGNQIAGRERQELNLSHARQWFVCDKGHGIVCPCGTFRGNPHGCKGCLDYEPSS